VSDVICFQAAKEERQPHWSGECVCLGCGHEWVGVAPIGTHVVECPSCGLDKGHSRHLFGPMEGDSVFQCDCGSEGLMAYLRSGRFHMICLACGVNHTEALFG